MKFKNAYSLFLILFFALVFVIGLTYSTWRWLYTLNLYTSSFTTFWSYALLFAEVLTFIVFTNFAVILLMSKRHKKIKPDNILQNDYSKDIYKDGELVTFENFSPSVDIFICTLNEDADMLATTISACKNIDYPNFKVYVLDDGRREQIKILTEMLECNYITRNTNKGYKSGNINNALSLTEGEIVVIFDADHCPASTFLKETVFNFIDENVAMVQTPQTFSNPDAFQKNLELAHFLANEQDIFYRVIEPSLDEFDSVFCGGTNILIKRAHLEAVGNFPENTITEDSLLGLIFHAMKFRIVYYNRPLAIGLAASSFEEYIKQRCRWAKGNVQIVTNKQNWGYYGLLTPIQAFFYLSGVLYFFTPIARLIFLIAPVLFLLFDITPVLILFYQIIAFQLGYFALKLLFIHAAKIRVSNVLFADVYDLITSIFTFGSIISVLLIPQQFAKFKFSVTIKNLAGVKTNYKYKGTLIIIFSLILFAQMQGIYDIMFSDVYSVLAVVANLFWNTVNLIVLSYGIKVVTEKPEKRTYQRLDVEDELAIREGMFDKMFVDVEDISRSGIKVLSAENLENKENLSIDIEGENNEVQTLSCKKNKNKFDCKMIFKRPIVLYKLTKRFVKRLDRFVKFAYKKPDKWDK